MGKKSSSARDSTLLRMLRTPPTPHKRKPTALEKGMDEVNDLMDQGEGEKAAEKLAVVLGQKEPKK